jgi:hypothetical protein
MLLPVPVHTYHQPIHHIRNNSNQQIIYSQQANYVLVEDCLHDSSFNWCICDR